jgi:alpha-ketoglutarate-dependent 2,4-dichlorophenoxyacetate dioxygenase
MRITKLGGTFAAGVDGVDLRERPDDALREGIEDALAHYGVLVFRGQRLDDDTQQAFIQAFGPPVVATLKEIRSNHPHFLDIGTVDDDGNPVEASSPRGIYMKANQLWHTDGSQSQPPIRLTALHARRLPKEPPPTEYADMRAAWNALPAARREALHGLVIEHNIFWSREQIGMRVEDFSEETRNSRGPVQHPLVRRHRRTGQASLYLASHASHVVGGPVAEGRALLRELIEFATRPEFVYAHDWEPDDLVMWDDSWTMHRATPYSGSEPRALRWCGVREELPV